jgi:hypothetical protein
MQSLIPNRFLLILLASGVAACGADHTTTDPGSGLQTSGSCPAIDLGPKPAALTATAASRALPVLGNGPDNARYQAEIALRGTLAYTSTWNVRRVQGDLINIWDVSGNIPALTDSVTVTGAITTGDVAVSDDGQLLMVATEYTPGSIAVYSLADPQNPKLLSRFSNDQTTPGVHTAKFGRVNGTLYGFLSVDPSGASFRARLVIVDLSDPTSPKQVFVKQAGSPYVHDTFERDGLLFVALWDDGLDIWDIGGCGGGASPASPRFLGNVKTIGGQVHNVWWYHDASGGKHYAFVGQEGPGAIGTSSQGDIHVVDVTDLTKPKEVAFYHVAGAGTHNFAVDEANGILYAAYYNAGVRAIDVRGDLGSCTAAQQDVNTIENVTRCNLGLMGRELGVGLLDQGKPVYVWGVKYVPGNVYASDMLNGIWKLGAAK